MVNKHNDGEKLINDFFENIQSFSSYPMEIIDKKFRTNSNLLRYWIKYKNVLYEKSLEPRFLHQYPKACEFIEIKYSGLLFELNNNIEQYFKIVEKLNALPEDSNDYEFKEETSFQNFWDTNYQKIYELSKNIIYQKKYPKACKIFEDYYFTYNEKRKKNTLIFNEKILILMTLIEHQKNISEKVLNFRLSKEESINDFIKNNQVKICMSAMDIRYQKKYPISTILIINYFQKTVELIENRIKEFLCIVEEIWSEDIVLSKISFSDGSSIEKFFNNYKELIYSVIILKKYNEIYPNVSRYIIANQEKDILVLEDKIEEFLKTVEYNYRNSKSIFSGVFCDNSNVQSFWAKNRIGIYNFIKSGIYKEKYPLACTLISRINQKREENIDKQPIIESQIEKKIIDFFSLVEKRCSLPIDGEDSTEENYNFWTEHGEELYKRSFSYSYNMKYPKASKIIFNRYEQDVKDKQIDQKYLEVLDNHFDFVEEQLINGAKVNITNFFGKRYLWYKNIALLRNLAFSLKFCNRYPRTCKLIRFELTLEEEKLKEFFQTIEDNGKIPTQREDIYFTNGQKMNQYWKDNKNKICEAIESEKYKTKYPRARAIIRYKINKNLKFEEFLQMIETENKIITRRHDRTFQDMASVGVYWESHKQDIVVKIESGYYNEKYPIACKIIKEAWDKSQEKKRLKQQTETEFKNNSKFNKVKESIEGKGKKKCLKNT